MISWAIRRKFLIISIIVLVLGLGAWGGYQFFLKKPPTCFDGKQDGRETGVDCGGSCAKLCTDEVKAPIMRWDPRVLKVSENNYSVLVYFENPNVSASVKKASYSIKVYGAKNSLIEDRKGSTSIPKHATFAILETNFSSPNTPPRADFSWNGNLDWQRDDAPVPEISVDSKSLTNADTKPRIDAIVTNKSFSDIQAIELTAIVTDGAGNAVGASKTILKNLTKGSISPITFTWPSPFITTSDICENPVDAMLVIDRSGSMKNFMPDVKSAAEDFLKALRTDDKVGVLSFANNSTAPPDFPISLDKDSAKSAIEAIAIDTKSAQNTNIADALDSVRSMFELSRDSQRSEVVILLTDGIPTLPTKKGVPEYPQIVAQNKSRVLKDMGVIIFTIGLGDKIDADFLRSISTSKDNFFSAPTTATLQTIYRSIASQICVKKPAQIDIIPRITENTGI